LVGSPEFEDQQQPDSRHIVAQVGLQQLGPKVVPECVAKNGEKFFNLLAKAFKKIFCSLPELLDWHFDAPIDQQLQQPEDVPCVAEREGKN
jgi:hypothetical protein